MTGLDRVFREEHGRVVASLARRFGDLDLAEEAAGEALVAAAERWPADGMPANPGGWLTTTATRKALDRLRRESIRDVKHQAAQMIQDDTVPEPPGPVEDDRLRLIFTCCHPALAPEARLALTLRLLGGLTVPEIARALLSTEAAVGRRITRAKAKIKAARIPYVVPAEADLAERLGTVLAVLYLIFNEGYLATAGEEAVRIDLTDEAIRLAGVLRSLLPDEPEAAGLLALMLLTEARRPARIADGELVTLADQDRGGWSRPLIGSGLALVRECLAINRPGPYQLQAAINAVHVSAPSFADTDWSQIVTLYDQWMAIAPSPVVALNRAVAVAELDGPAVALALVEALGLTAYQPWHATRAELLRRLGRGEEARTAYAEAIRLSGNPAERAWLARRMGQLVTDVRR